MYMSKFFKALLQALVLLINLYMQSYFYAPSFFILLLKDAYEAYMGFKSIFKNQDDAGGCHCSRPVSRFIFN